ncbi:MAG TPA: TIGR01841 family phasin [Burkholderiaceae bacterium]|nr:TIGR01841 family phasin [Burkholderiaceae bacterium]
MATKARKSTGKSRSRKSAARRPAAKKAAAARPARAEGLFDMSLAGLGRTLEGLNLSSVASTIAEGRRKDLAALVAANKKSYEGLQAVVARQTAMLKNAVSEWQSMAQGAGGAPGFGRLDDAAKQTFSLAVQNIRELAELAAKSQTEAFEIVRRRIMENVEEVNALIRRGR